MSLIRPRWMLLAAAAGASGFTLWLLLAPQATPPALLPSIGRVDAEYFPPAPLDLAVSAGLFVPTEAPDPSLANSAASGGVAAAPAPPPRLVGIATKRGASVALAVDQSGQTRMLRPGEEIDGWTLAGTGRDHATFVQGARQERVALDFGNKAGGAGGAPTRQLVDTGGQDQ